jgi:hypothetical protein
MANVPYDGAGPGVTYWMRWEYPTFWVQDDEARDRGVFEIGWKQTHASGCHNGASGNYPTHSTFPPSAKVMIDYSEDSDDAVLWVTDMDVVAYVQIAQPEAEFSAGYRCSGSDIIDGAVGDSTFAVSTGRCVASGVLGECIPAATFQTSGLNYVPAENGWRGLPSLPNTNRHMSSDAPWTNDWSFEGGVVAPSPFVSNDLTQRRICGAAMISRCYLYLEPSSGPGIGGQATRVVQAFWVKTFSDNVRYPAGLYTGKQFGAYVRCPAWSPAWSLRSGACLIGVNVRTQNSSLPSQTYLWNVPADGMWYSLLHDGFDGTTLNDSLVVLTIDTYGYPLDIDGVWVSSDY